MENNIEDYMKIDSIEKSDEFYYDGVPSINGGFSTNENFSVLNEETINASDTSGAAEKINEMVCGILATSQIIFVLLGVLCILKGISNFRKNKQIIVEGKDEAISSYKDRAYLSNDENTRKKSVFSYFIFSGVLFFVSLMISIIRDFSHKPIIYIYPEEEREVKIKAKNPEKFTCTYPKYEDEWNVLAKPNGDLIDLKTNRKLYALYWEGINTVKPNLKEGFIVEGENVAKFLEEKLEILGLNEREAEEFIIYWLPLMEKNKYNYVRFESLEEINENMGLEITPKPDTLIRINMEFRPLRKPFEVKEQILQQVERKGYTVVEWGGTKL